jgi:hypothetical protein
VVLCSLHGLAKKLPMLSPYRVLNLYSVSVKASMASDVMFIKLIFCFMGALMVPNVSTFLNLNSVCKTQCNIGPQKRSHKVIVAE